MANTTVSNHGTELKTQDELPEYNAELVDDLTKSAQEGNFTYLQKHMTEVLIFASVSEETADYVSSDYVVGFFDLILETSNMWKFEISHSLMEDGAEVYRFDYFIVVGQDENGDYKTGLLMFHFILNDKGLIDTVYIP